MEHVNRLKAESIIPQLWEYIIHNKELLLLYSKTISFFPLLVFALVGFILLLLIRRLLNFKELLQEDKVFLELTPPAFTEKTAYTTQQFFSVLHNLGSQRTFWERLLGRKVLFSFEIISTKDQGIRYILRVNRQEAEVVKQNVFSYLPQVKVTEIEDYLPEKLDFRKVKVIEFKLSNHFAFPLAKQNLLTQHDPVAYITGTMTKLLPDELMSFQVVVSPTRTYETTLLSQKILRNENVLKYLNKTQVPWYIKPVTVLFSLIIKCFQLIIGEVLWFINDFFHGDLEQKRYAYNLHYQQQLRSEVRPARVLSTSEQELVTSIQEKIDQPLFETTIRAFVKVHDNQGQNHRIRGIKSSLALFSVQKYQSFRAKYNFPPLFMENIRLFAFKHRMLSLFTNASQSLLSVSEIADLYHFPYSDTTKTENIVKAYSKELPAPISLKNGRELDTVFAKNIYAQSTTMIGLTEEERRRHVYILGATGTGKSTLLLSMINSDLHKGKGLCVVDPHGELVEAVLASIPEDKYKDVIYFNPDDLKYPIGLNLMELTPGLSEEDSLREKEFIAESVISLFRKVFSDAWASHPHRIEYILRNTIHTAFTLENPTLFTLYDLLTDTAFQKRVVKNLTDERLKKFWQYEFGKAGDWQQVKMISPVTAKIGRFLFSPAAKRILEQGKSTIDIAKIMDEGKILVCNLSKGKLSEDTSKVLGILILNKVQLATLQRARQESNIRRDFYLYVDEFQNFATPSFIQMLSEARKYKLNIILAEQTTSQIEDNNLVNIILANVGTIICFRTANPDDEKRILPQFSPHVDENEIFNLPSFHFYMKVSAMNSQEPFSGETIPIETPKDHEKTNEIKKLSRENYAKEYLTDQQKEEKVIVKKTKQIKDNKEKVDAPTSDQKQSKQDVLPGGF